MITYAKGSLLDVTEGILLQQVNAQGVMGSGLAKSLRDRYPVIWETYSAWVKPHQYDQGRSYMGNMIPVQVSDDLIVYNLVGQLHYGKGPNPWSADGRYTSYDALSDALAKVRRSAGGPFHTVRLGCDRGRGEWPIVEALINHHLRGYEVTVWDLD